MFDLFGNERLAKWKNIRNNLETSLDPLSEVSHLWCSAPLVSNYLNPFNSNSWPDPWRLILDGKFDNLAICLGMLYTLQLTQRFMNSKYEIHMAIDPKIKDPVFYLSIDRSFVLNYVYKEVINFDNEIFRDTTLLYSIQK